MIDIDEEKALIAQSQFEHHSKISSETNVTRRKRKHLRYFTAILSIVLLSLITNFNLLPPKTNINKSNQNEDKLSKDEVFDAYLLAMQTNLASNWSKIYTSESHLAGTNYEMVQWASSQFASFGLQVEIDEYEVYLSYPIDHSLRLLHSHSGDLIYEAPLLEDEIEEDGSTIGEGKIPTFLGYGGNGNITAEFVYCNYGSMEDFAKLKELGVDVKGKIAIVRYGKIFRGLKVKFAQDEGAIGVLLYSDPADDSGMTEFDGIKTYPKGPGRQPSSVQRGSVQFLSVLPGDPTTPGYGSKRGVKRTDPFLSTPRIPVLPISYREIIPILKKMNGYGYNMTDVDEKWVGKLPKIDYSIGPNPKVELEMYSEQHFNITPIWNVYAKIEGENTDEVIIVGNHHDAWIKGGAGDPNSGSAVMMELARGLGYLQSEYGWKPKRTIMLCSWDGEEYGLIGSTEFGETMSKFIQANVIAYLNLDVACVGDLLSLHASPSLFDLLRSVAKLVEHPGDEMNLYDHFVKRGKDHIVNLGSGSDYTVFLEHLGIPSLDLSFRGDEKKSTTPVYHYHSNYDSYHWMSKFGDPGFKYHNTMAKYLGLLVLELSETKVIRFSNSDEAGALTGYFNDAISDIPSGWLHLPIGHQHTYWNHLHYNTVSSGRFSGRGSGDDDFGCSQTRTLTQLIETVQSEFVTFQNKSLEFDAYARDLQTSYEVEYPTMPVWRRLKLRYDIYKANKVLKFMERQFLYDQGLNNRSWFKHMIFASGRFTGYAGQTFPGLRESIEDMEFDDCVSWLIVYLKCISRINRLLG